MINEIWHYINFCLQKRIKKHKKRYKDLKKLTEIVNKLASGEELDVKYRDHALANNLRYKDCRECHIEPDWLLIYKKNNTELTLFLIETGTHSDLF